jgi:hypothetical protein
LCSTLTIEAIGFEPPEIDLRIQSLDSALEEADDQFELATGPVVSRTGDLWLLGSHRLFCGSALDAASYDALSNGEKAAAAITDVPYNVRIVGHVSGNGRTTHREFAMASGEMSEAEFSDFLHQTFQRISAYCRDGALIYSFMDWRHMAEILAAGRAANLDLLNLCVWAKPTVAWGLSTGPATSLCSSSRADTTRIPTIFNSAASAATVLMCGIIRGPTASGVTAPKSSWNRIRR